MELNLITVLTDEELESLNITGELRSIKSFITLPESVEQCIIDKFDEEFGFGVGCLLTLLSTNDKELDEIYVKNLYNYKDLSKIYLFSNNDINFIRLQFLKIPKSSGVEMAMDFIDRGTTTPSRKRAFIASILYLYRHQALISYMDKTWEEYWTQNRQKALENFLHKVISK